MTPSAVAVCVHALATGKVAEFRFPGARYEISGGALRVLSPDGSDLMAFAGGIWHAAWMEDEQGEAMGLAPGARAAPPAPTASAAPQSAGSDKGARAALAQRAFDRLASAPYAGLGRLASDLGADHAELERALSEALHQGRANPEALALEAPQRFMDAALPEIIERRRPRTISDIMGFLRDIPEARDCDYVQLRIWLARNPLPRRAPPPPPTPA